MFLLVFVVETIIRVSVIVSIVYFSAGNGVIWAPLSVIFSFLENLRMFYLFLSSNVIRRYCINCI